MKLGALCACVLAAAGARAAEDPQWYLQADNDVVFVTDRWYTSGVRIARSHRAGDDRRIEWGIVQEIYTANTNRHQPDDRPYAARLYLSGARHDYSEDTYRTLELTAGMRGPSALGRQTQELVHRIVPAPEDDWSRQLPNRLDLQAIASFSRNLSVCGTHCVVHYGGSAGTTLVFAHVGAELRTGGAQQLASPSLRFAATPPVAAAHGWSAFAGASGRWVVRNTLLDGNNDPGAPDVERKHAVLRFSAGIAWATPWGVVSFALTRDTREFETQRAMQRFGTLAVHIPF